jgi:hypothetical protein
MPFGTATTRRWRRRARPCVRVMLVMAQASLIKIKLVAARRFASMPYLPWPAFMGRNRAAHVVGVVTPEGDRFIANARWARELVHRLIHDLAPKGVYAFALKLDQGVAIHRAFAKESDAAKFAKAARARGAGRYPGWASQGAFLLDAEVCRAIAAALKGAPSVITSHWPSAGEARERYRTASRWPTYAAGLAGTFGVALVLSQI